ncbi:LexA-binding, inner membrane-associated putative hydrolase [Haloarcula vallismortis]|uniref:Membrane-bound metal-dependent hydrolase n=2 Tax=Haloarcula vallismortis TaxID=28442 RepID=M0JEM1_HALVA|nr:metal-dependent hydrolase [Haloarcula vallismortis]EMA07582.1 membrane-bound metal-dependent hydrolase [Haloarcula vallismortis ATCC 29715]SDW76927.1 LexA-binding, inner membrane-associated putative hydrolase [Haloarcula vallismortis]
MFVGHALFAFALGALAARWLGLSRERAVQLGVVAGLFAAVPDVDIVYAPFGLLVGAAENLTADSFWETANVVHRGPTHSLVLGAILAAAAGLWATDSRPARTGALSIGVALTALTGALSGPVAALVMLVFGLAVLGVATVAQSRDISPRTVTGLALLGLLTHPFGDLFTGGPPPFFYPFDVTLVAERVLLHPDPTTHLLAAFTIELATVWLAVWTYVHLRGDSLTELVRPRAALGIGYAAAVLFLPAPTLERSAHFVFSVLALGVVGAPTRPFSDGVDWLETVVTGLAAVTIAALAYAMAYGAI